MGFTNLEEQEIVLSYLNQSVSIEKLKLKQILLNNNIILNYRNHLFVLIAKFL
jgi:hypothetical protein